jgi:hypothetical protein
VLLGLLVFVSRVAGGVVRERSHRPQLHLVFVWIVISIIWFGPATGRRSSRRS